MGITADIIKLRFDIQPQYDQQQMNELKGDLKDTVSALKSTYKEIEKNTVGYKKLTEELRNLKANRDRLNAQKIRTAEEEKQLARINKRIAECSQKIEENKVRGAELNKTYREQTLAVQNANKKLEGFFEQMDLGKMPLSDLIARQKDLNILVRELKPDTDDFKKYAKALKDTEIQIEKTKEEIYGTKNALEKSESAWGRFSKAVVAVNAVFQIKDRIVSWADQYVQSFAKMDDAMTNVMKYTNQTKAEVEDMNEEFKKMTTRTAREELNELAGAAGRLGIQGKENIIGFVDAADKINVALGDDLGEGAIDQIGKLTMVFGEDKTKGLNGAMLATGSAINVLGANSSANTGFITEFTSSMAGMAVNAKISQTDIMGYASALSQAGIEGQTASGVFAQLITKMFTDPAKFARAAKLDVKGFVDLLKTDANAAILQFLEGLKQNGGFDALAPALKSLKMQGTQAVPVISSLINKMDELKKAQRDARKAYDEGTSIIEEFDNANSSAAAKLEIAQKRLNDVAVELGQKLMPIVEGGIKTSTVALQILSELISFGTKHIWIIGTAATALAAYTLIIEAHTIKTNAARIATAAFNAVMASSPAGWLAVGITAVVSALAYFGVEASKAAKEAEKLNVKYMSQKKALEDLDDARKNSVSKISDERSRIERLTNIIHSNAFSIAERRQAIEKLQNIVPGYHASLSNEGTLHETNANAIKKHIEQLNNLAMAEALADKMRQVQSDKFEAEEKLRRKKYNVKAVQAELNAHPEKYNKTETLSYGDGIDYSEVTTFTKEGRDKRQELKTQQLAEQNAQKEYDIQVERQRQIMDYIQRNKGLNEAYTSVLIGGNTSGNPSGPGSADGDSGGGSGSGGTTNKKQSELDRLRKEEEAQAKQTYEREKLELRQQYEGKKQLQDEWHQKQYDAEVRYLAQIGKLRDEYNADESEKMEAQNQILDAQIRESNYQEERRKRNQQESLRNIDQYQAEEELKLARQQLDGEIKTKEEFDQKKLAVEIHYQKMRLQYLQSGSQEYLAAQKQLLSLELQQEQQSKKAEEDFKKSYYDTGNSSLQNVMGDLETFDERLAMNEAYYNADLISFQQYQQNKTAIEQEQSQARQEIQNAAIELGNQALQAAQQMFQMMQQREVSQVEAKYKKLIADAKKQGKDTTKLEEQQEAEKMAIKKKYAQKEFQMKVLQIISSTAMAIADVWSKWAGTPYVAAVLTALAAAEGAVQLASAKAAANQAAGLYEGGFSEGYTKKGDPKKQAGVIPVHQNEFVANHKAVANPNVRPVLDVIDRHQKIGDIQMLDTTRMLEEAYGSGRYRGGYSRGGSGEMQEDDSRSIGSNQEIMEILLQIADNTADAITLKDLRKEIRHQEQLEGNARR